MYAIRSYYVSLFRQAQALSGAAFGVYVEDASFFRLREASLTFNASRSFAGTFGARSFNATITARNIFMITGYSSWDPENVTQSSDAANYNFLQQRQPLVMVLRFNLGY